MSRMRLARPSVADLIGFSLSPAVVLLLGCTVPTPVHAANAQPDPTCGSAEECFSAVRGQMAQAGGSAVDQDKVQSMVDRLRVVMEQYPGSIWAKRAGLLMGVLLAEREPAEAVRFLKAAQRDLPLLEDYIRFWTAGSLLKLGDAAQAATLFEFIPQAVPDTLLVSQAAFRGGEAWYKAGQCAEAIDLLDRAVSLVPQDPGAPTALSNLADCQLRQNRHDAGLATLKQLWVQYPNTPEARDATVHLSRSVNGEVWRPGPDDLYERALSFLNLSLHDEAVGEMQKFLAAAPNHPRRNEARLKLGLALVRLKRYEQAREVFQGLAADRIAESDEAAVWLARIYLRQGDGARLLALRQSLPRLSLSEEQQAAILIFEGTWLEDGGQFEEAIARYRQAAQARESAGYRTDALWRIGWIRYRAGSFRDAIETFQEVVNGKEDAQFTPQALYWMGRAMERLMDREAPDVYLRLCQRYAYTYYCQLASARAQLPPSIAALQAASPPARDGKAEVWQDVHYRRALELKILGMDQDAARELVSLTDRYTRDRSILLELSALLNETGAYSPALRVARLYFRDALERGGEPAPQILWTVGYPTGYLPTIRAHAGSQVDPYLVTAIIREESQYDARAISRVGAVGLMQVMPGTAQAVARRFGLPNVIRDDLFDQETNIRFGIGYLKQLLQQFSGNVLLAVAAYNAGPPAVSAWVTKNGDKEPDEFVELIPYQETRQYVKRVLRSYREYHRLGRGTCDARSLDKVC
ncbi:MAG: transglycosylase SLT domain-containing protein [Nitrospiraceae bacterium]